MSSDEELKRLQRSAGHKPHKTTKNTVMDMNDDEKTRKQ
jgi:hypothetical protein